MSGHPNIEDLFERRLTYPDVDARDRLARLVGLDEQKSRLAKMLGLLVHPEGLQAWAKKFHPGSEEILSLVLRRPPLVVLAGDVGAGKTELAETIGDAVARQEKIDIVLLPLSLSTRGKGLVGEMSKLLSSAFDFAIGEASKMRSREGRARGAVLLLVDEADAIAQSREESQMHHEDRAGVNTFIRGIDRIANGRVPCAVLMCTNRLSALDPALRRRAADILPFARPDDSQRFAVVGSPLAQLGLSEPQIAAIVGVTGQYNGRDHGFTFSDLTQRFLPAVVLDAYPSASVHAERVLEIAKSLVPTPPFRDGQR